MNKDYCVTLNNGALMPRIGLGVFKIPDDQEVARVVEFALNNGYDLIDTATVYENEAGVGVGIRNSGRKREDIFITTKLWNAEQGKEKTRPAFEKSLEVMGLDYVDLYLIHWPGLNKKRMVETWAELIEIQKTGRARAIGVSNFTLEDLDLILRETGVAPTVNQVECHPWHAQKEMLEYMKGIGGYVQAWGPLMQGHLAEEPVLHALAEKYGKSAAQVALRWNYQRGVLIIPKSVKEHRMKENIDIFDFQISQEDMEKIDAVDKGGCSGLNPATFTFGFVD